jgi:hypothetical protein
LEEFQTLGKTKVIFVNTLSNDRNISVREGALKDVASMKAACQALHFNFECVTTNSNDDLEILSQRLADENFTKFSKVVVMMLGHGNQNDEIVSHNDNGI